MCGITGLIGSYNAEYSRSILDKMLNAIQHRGPDGQGCFVAPAGGRTIAMGMRRLAIVDLSGGDQPIASPQGQQIIMNGEIYNYRSLREDLQAKGYPFHTHSDTEVALASYALYGLPAAIAQWQGMFAVAIYDPAAMKLFLIRDRFGKKPLYYGRIADRFWFGSELKSLIAGFGSRPAVNMQSVEDYRAFRYVPAPETIWQGIYKLPPGSFLTLDLKTLDFKIESYWQPRVVSSSEAKPQALDEFTTLFHQAVEKRLLAADVPIGVLLSGGLDSSAVAAAARALGHDALKSYSIHFDHAAAFNERPYAEQVAAHVGTHHNCLMMSVDDFKKDLYRLVEITDEPLADLATIPLYRVCEFAGKDVKVLLSGEGSDEILAGYHYDQLARKYDILRAISGVIPKYVLAKMPQPIFKSIVQDGWSGIARSQVSDPTLISHDYLHAVQIVRDAYDACPSPELIDQMQQVMMGNWLVEDLLMKADKSSMAASVELRCPFLDHDLAEFCFALPLSWKVGGLMKGYTTKRVLREYARTRLPVAIINRSKQGFPVPAAFWLRNDLADWGLDVLMTSRLDSLCSRVERESLWRCFSDGQEQLSQEIWRLIILALWQERWLHDS